MNSERISRRLLLLSAAAAVAAPYVITSAALGNAQKAPASERVTLGHIGVGDEGWIPFRHVAELPRVAERRYVRCVQEPPRSRAKMCGGKAYADFRELLARDDIDGVVVATPDHWHVPMAIAAARAKKDAYVEKPLAVSIEQCLACLKVFEENQRVFQYGTQQRARHHCRFGCELVRAARSARSTASK